MFTEQPGYAGSVIYLTSHIYTIISNICKNHTFFFIIIALFRNSSCVEFVRFKVSIHSWPWHYAMVAFFLFHCTVLLHCADKIHCFIIYIFTKYVYIYSNCEQMICLDKFFKTNICYPAKNFIFI